MIYFIYLTYLLEPTLSANKSHLVFPIHVNSEEYDLFFSDEQRVITVDAASSFLRRLAALPAATFSCPTT